MSITSAKIDNIGSYAESEGNAVGSVALVADEVIINTVKIGASTAGTGDGRVDGSAWAKMNAINAKTSESGVTATAETKVTGSAAVTAGTLSAGELTINGIAIGATTVLDNDSDHALMDAINAKSAQTYVTASLDSTGAMILTADEGENIDISDAANAADIFHIGANGTDVSNRGKITLTSSEGSIAVTEGTTANATVGHTGTIAESGNLGTINVKTFEGAQTAIKITDAALKEIDKMRANIGSTQNQLESTVRNISVTQVNVTAAESTIRDVDFAAESANLQKHNILAQSGVYAMSQANSAQQNVMRLLQ
jgi:flagellin